MAADPTEASLTQLADAPFWSHSKGRGGYRQRCLESRIFLLIPLFLLYDLLRLTVDVYDILIHKIQCPKH